MITLETTAGGRVTARSIDVIAEADFVWTGGGAAEDDYRCETTEAWTQRGVPAPQVTFRADGSLLDLRIGQPAMPSIVADQLLTAVLVNIVTCRGRVTDLRGRAILAAGDGEVDHLSHDDIEPHLATAKLALAWVFRELDEIGRSDEVRLQAGAPFRLCGLDAIGRIAGGRAKRRPVPLAAQIGDMSIEIGVVVVTSRDNPIPCVRAVGASTIAAAGVDMARRPILARLADNLWGVPS